MCVFVLIMKRLKQKFAFFANVLFIFVNFATQDVHAIWKYRLKKSICVKEYGKLRLWGIPYTSW